MPKLTLVDGGFPQIQMSAEIKRKMELIIHSVDTEIGWMGKVDRHRNGVYVITEVYVPKQEVNGGTCEITEDGLAELATDILEKDGMEEYNKLRLWGHSHPTFSTSPSGQDNTQMKDLFKNVKDFFVRLIANKKGEYNFTIYEMDRNLVTEEAEHFIISEDDDELAAEIKATVAKNVKALTYTHTSYQNHGYGGYGYGGEDFWEWDDKADRFVKKAETKTSKTPKAKKTIGFGADSKEDPKKDFTARGVEKGGYQYYGCGD
jgi:hypothetical protein